MTRATVLLMLSMGCIGDDDDDDGRESESEAEAESESENECISDCAMAARCGDDDGCGGHCDGACMAGFCQRGYCCDPAWPSCCEGAATTLSTDTANCGSCGFACEAGDECRVGLCGATCAPSCAGDCGDDGCGGSCGSCDEGSVCIDRSCAACVPVCTGISCGSDGCGGSCGDCAAGETCTLGACSACTPSCVGRLCGDDDDCGGTCDGACPGGGVCAAGACSGACAPDCAGKACGNDGCGGSCGSCAEGFDCQAGMCACTPWCSVLGRQCGSDDCGGSCGACDEGDVCGGLGTCVLAPEIVGCSDSTREGFANLDVYAEIASCQAAWAAQSMRATRTGAACGNNLAACPVPEDACAGGWHLCMKNGWPGDLADRISGDDCTSPGVAGPVKFVGGSSIAVAANNCTLPLPCNGNSEVCCGAGCYFGDNSWNDCVWPNQTAWVSWGDCNNVGSVSDGVLCCQDPPVVGY
ncbi:MAG: hypothetical protein AABZ30_09195 [Myxococcota bacterium]